MADNQDADKNKLFIKSVEIPDPKIILIMPTDKQLNCTHDQGELPAKKAYLHK